MNTTVLKLIGLCVLLASLPLKAFAAEDAAHKIVIKASSNDPERQKITHNNAVSP